MKILNILFKTVLAITHTLLKSFGGLFLGLNTFIRGFFILGIVVLWLSSLMGHPAKSYDPYIGAVVIILISTLIDVFFVAIVNGMDEYLYGEDE